MMSSPWKPLALLGITIAVTAGNATLVAAWADLVTIRFAENLSVIPVWSLAGAVAWWRRPRSRMGVLMMAVSLFAAVTMPNGALHTSSQAASVLLTVVAAINNVVFALGAHTMLAYPSGRLPDRPSRYLVIAAYAVAAFDGLRTVLTRTYGPRDRPGPWAESLLRVTSDLGVEQAFGLAVALCWAVLAVAFAGLVIHRFASATPRKRQTLAISLFAVGVTVALFVARMIWYAGHVTAGWGRPTMWLLISVEWAGTAAVPIAYLIGLLRERLAYASLGDLIRTVGDLPADQIEPALAHALRDPGLRLAFPVAGHHLDTGGRPVTLPAHGGVTVLGDPASPLAVLIHDRTLEEEPGLLDAAGAATRLALENARLQAEVRAQLAQVRASRARIVAAGDAARRRLERDLHDGAQQRLLTLGLLVRMLHGRLDGIDEAARRLADEAAAEVRLTLAELRELARGIHPAILTDQGLRPALDQLVLRCGVPVTVTGDDPGRWPAEVESTAYFVVSEALANVAKHARAGGAVVNLTHDGDLLVVTVSDDGVGGADPAAGTGLTGLADRAAAVNGRFTLISPPGAGTDLRVELPCASR